MPGGLRVVVQSFKFRQNRLNGFRDLGGRNLPFSILKASGLYNSLYYRTSRDRSIHNNQYFSRSMQDLTVMFQKHTPIEGQAAA